MSELPELFEDGSTVIWQHPHPAFDKIIGRGYAVAYRLEQEGGSLKDLVVRALHGDRVVGEADFSDYTLGAHCQNVSVDPGHQRQGIASALYVFAETVFGKPPGQFLGERPQTDPGSEGVVGAAEPPVRAPDLTPTPSSTSSRGTCTAGT
jgi:hypothetical protein